MARATLTRRVEVLEEIVSGLATLPARVSAIERELGEFRAEVKHEFGAVRAEMRAGDERLHTEMRSLDESLRGEIRGGNEETRRYMRVLYEDLIDRIARSHE